MCQNLVNGRGPEKPALKTPQSKTQITQSVKVDKARATGSIPSIPLCTNGFLIQILYNKLGMVYCNSNYRL